MTGQIEAVECDHIIGLWLDPYDRADRLTSLSEGLDVDDPFSYCPSCGKPLEVSGSVISLKSLPCTELINEEISFSS